MDQVLQFATNVTSMAYHALDVIEEHTGLPPVAFFTILALLVGAYFLISGILVPSQITAPPPASSVTPGQTPQPLLLGVISAVELSEYDGRNAGKPLLMAIKGQIYDVSSARDFYGPGGPYAVFAGKDASRALARMTFDEKDLCGNLEGLSEAELCTLKEWEDRFCSKYTKVGSLKPEQSDDETSAREGEQAAKKNVINVEVKQAAPLSSRDEPDDERATDERKEGGEGSAASTSPEREGESKEKAEAEEREFEMVDKVKGPAVEGEESGVTSVEGSSLEKGGTSSSALDEGLSSQSAKAAEI